MDRTKMSCIKLAVDYSVYDKESLNVNHCFINNI